MAVSAEIAVRRWHRQRAAHLVPVTAVIEPAARLRLHARKAGETHAVLSVDVARVVGGCSRGTTEDLLLSFIVVDHVANSMPSGSAHQHQRERADTVSAHAFVYTRTAEYKLRGCCTPLTVGKCVVLRAKELTLSACGYSPGAVLSLHSSQKRGYFQYAVRSTQVMNRTMNPEGEGSDGQELYYYNQTNLCSS